MRSRGLIEERSYSPETQANTTALFREDEQDKSTKVGKMRCFVKFKMLYTFRNFGQLTLQNYIPIDNPDINLCFGIFRCLWLQRLCIIAKFFKRRGWHQLNISNFDVDETLKFVILINPEHLLLTKEFFIFYTMVCCSPVQYYSA